jgi:RNA polymerase sigma-70 factor (ECF subfamily)
MMAYQQGEAEAFDLLFAQLTPALYRFFLAQEATRGEAEDLLQETCLRVHSFRHTYRPGEPVLAWVYGIARHIRIDAYRKHVRRSRREIAADVLHDFAGPEPQSGSVLDPCWKQLPESQREVLTMLKVTGMSLDEVARALGTSVGSVKQKSHRAYTALRECLGGRSTA